MSDTFDLRSGAATIVIDEGPYAGVEVVVLLDAPYRVRRETARLVAEYRAADPGSDTEAAAVDALYALMASEIVLGWNLVIAGEPVEVSPEGLHRGSLNLAMTILGTWRQYVGMVMPPLSPSSPSTGEPPQSTGPSSSDGGPDPASAPTPEPLSTP